MAIWILTSVEKFYFASKEILIKNSANICIEFGDGKGNALLVQIEEENENKISEMVVNGIRDFTYRNFVILQNCTISLDKSAYKQPDLEEYFIIGRGGRETQEEIECIYLSILLKETNKITKSLFDKIIRHLKKNVDFKQSFSSASSMFKRALYDIRLVDKVKKHDLINPLSLLKIEDFISNKL